MAHKKNSVFSCNEVSTDWGTVMRRSLIGPLAVLFMAGTMSSAQDIELKQPLATPQLPATQPTGKAAEPASPSAEPPARPRFLLSSHQPTSRRRLRFLLSSRGSRPPLRHPQPHPRHPRHQRLHQRRRWSLQILQAVRLWRQLPTSLRRCRLTFLSPSGLLITRFRPGNLVSGLMPNTCCGGFEEPTFRRSWGQPRVYFTPGR